MERAELPTEFPPLPPGTAPLWTGILGGPTAWAIQFAFAYAYVHQACLYHNRWILFIVTVVFFLLAIAGGIVCLSWLRNTTAGDDPEHQRIHFLASYGLLTAAISALVILAQGIAIGMLDPCSS